MSIPTDECISLQSMIIFMGIVLMIIALLIIKPLQIIYKKIRKTGDR